MTFFVARSESEGGAFWFFRACPKTPQIRPSLGLFRVKEGPFKSFTSFTRNTPRSGRVLKHALASPPRRCRFIVLGARERGSGLRRRNARAGEAGAGVPPLKNRASRHIDK